MYSLVVVLVVSLCVCSALKIQTSAKFDLGRAVGTALVGVGIFASGGDFLQSFSTERVVNDAPLVTYKKVGVAGISGGNLVLEPELALKKFVSKTQQSIGCAVAATHLCM
jgi:hypothetical protein